ncbi:hypothetical protein B0H13DRAFT_2507773 [Mycena leptocephala]|nr:hypothetical protein B0H13DRAFT_2507773 [Mycena leptocephala]
MSHKRPPSPAWTSFWALMSAAMSTHGRQLCACARRDALKFSLSFVTPPCPVAFIGPDIFCFRSIFTSFLRATGFAVRLLYFILFHLISLVCHPQLPAAVFISTFLAVYFPSILAPIFDSARGGDVVRSAAVGEIVHVIYPRAVPVMITPETGWLGGKERSVKQQPALPRIPSYGVLVQPHPSPPAATHLSTFSLYFHSRSWSSRRSSPGSSGGAQRVRVSALESSHTQNLMFAQSNLCAIFLPFFPFLALVLCLYESRLSPALVRACRREERDTRGGVSAVPRHRGHTPRRVSEGGRCWGCMTSGGNERYGKSIHIPATAPPAATTKTTAMDILIPTTSTRKKVVRKGRRERERVSSTAVLCAARTHHAAETLDESAEPRHLHPRQMVPRGSALRRVRSGTDWREWIEEDGWTEGAEAGETEQLRAEYDVTEEDRPGRGCGCGGAGKASGEAWTGRQLKREDAWDAEALASRLGAFARPRLGDVVDLSRPWDHFEAVAGRTP